MRRLLVVLTLLLTFACDAGQRLADFPEFAAGDIKYRIFIPKGRDPDVKIPVMLYLHGSGARGDDNHSQLGGFPEWVDEHPERFQFAIVFPQCPTNTFWTASQIEKAIALLDEAVNQVNGDEKRLYLAGYSMGGFGVWQTAITHPDKFAALIPVAGGVEPLGVISAEDRSLLSPQVAAAGQSLGVYPAYANALKNVPVWIVHGDKDDSVPVDQSRKMAEALRTAGGKDVNYLELEGVDHASIGNAFRDERLFTWLKGKSK